MMELLWESLPVLLPFIAVGFAAQLIDGALGMAYGVISSTLLIAMGLPPKAASAGTHAAETFKIVASASLRRMWYIQASRLSSSFGPPSAPGRSRLTSVPRKPAQRAKKKGTRNKSSSCPSMSSRLRG